MPKTPPTLAAIAAEERLFQRRPDWELRNMARALKIAPWLNTEAEDARLAAVERIQRKRAREKARGTKIAMRHAYGCAFA